MCRLLARFWLRKIQTPRRPKLVVEPLENRWTPSWSSTLGGGSITFTGDAGWDTVSFAADKGILIHNWLGGSFEDNYDMDSTLVGSQSISVGFVTNLTVNGGDGFDTASFADLPIPANVNVDHFVWTAVDAAYANADVVLTNAGFTVTDVPSPFLYGVTNLVSAQIVGGVGNNKFDCSAVSHPVRLDTGLGNDTLIGGAGNDDLRGNEGDDIILGNDGNDTSQGDVGLDSYIMGAGNDWIYNEAGPTYYDGGPGDDWVYNLTASQVIVTNAGMTVDGVTSPGNMEAFDLYGTSGNDLFDLSALTSYNESRQYGNDGNDTLLGGSKTDYLHGQNGVDLLIGNDGIDGINAGINIYNGGIIADGDTVLGGAGNDILMTEGGADHIDGGADFDTLLGYSAESVVIADSSLILDGLTSPGACEYYQMYGDEAATVMDAGAYTLGDVRLHGEGGHDTIIGGSGNDFLVGGQGEDAIFGNAGNDEIAGQGGDDALSGGDGDDVLDGGSENDSFDGGLGYDRALVSGVTNALITDSKCVFDGREGPNRVEYFQVYCTAGNDFVDASAWTLGKLYCEASAGTDTLLGGAGDDAMTINTGLINGHGGNDIIYGIDGSTLIGGAGDDTFNTGNYHTGISIDGGPGQDMVVMSGFSSLVATATSLVIDGFASPGAIEGVYGGGTNGNDLCDISAVSPTTLSSYFQGGEGDDTIRGAGGYDYLYGGDGADFVYGNGNADEISVGENTTNPAVIQIADGGDGNDGVSGGNARDHLIGGPGNDTLIGLGDNDILDGGPEANQLAGGDGDDILTTGFLLNTATYTYGGNGTDKLTILATAADEAIDVQSTLVNFNGNTSVTITDMEDVTIEAGAGVDSGVQSAPTAPYPYVINGLEPTVLGGADETSTASLFTRTGDWSDIGDPNTAWTAKANYGDGTGFHPVPLNLGAKTFSISHTYTAGGNFNVTVFITDTQGNTGSDTFVLTRPAGVNVGTSEGSSYSMGSLVAATFNQIMTVNPGAFVFEALGPGPLPTVTPVIDEFNGGTRIRFTFTGAVDSAFSLMDGKYRLTLVGANILDPLSQPFDGNGDGTPAGDLVFNFHRLFGDFDGNLTVDGTDFAAFGATFGGSNGGLTYDPAFDYDGNGTIDGADLGDFGNRFGRTL